MLVIRALLALLAIISVIGIFAGNVYLLHKAITFDSPEAVAQRFGEFKEGEQLKLKKVNDFQLMLVGVFGAILPEFTGVGSFRSIDMYSLAYKSDGLTITGVVVLPEEDGDFPALAEHHHPAGRVKTQVREGGDAQPDKAFMVQAHACQFPGEAVAMGGVCGCSLQLSWRWRQ